MSEINNTEQTPEIIKDESLDLKSLMSTSKKLVDEKKEEVSPLDSAISSKKEKGIIVSNEEIEKEMQEEYDKHHLKSTFESDERQKNFEEKRDEILDYAEKAKLVSITRKPTNPAEDALMMQEISQVYIDDNNEVVIPENAVFVTKKGTGGDFTPREISGDEEEIRDNNINNDEPETVNLKDITDEELEKKRKRETTINIIIDKTGLGTDIEFDDREKKLLSSSNEIHVTEVESLELETIQTDFNIDDDDDDISFLDDIDKYQLSVSKTNMVFPASGFKADMLGMSWGELANITLDISDQDNEDYLNFDKMYKKFTVIYKKMKNATCGEFKDFDDFLKKFAYDDVPLATFGLLISTQPEHDSIALRCRKSGCEKSFVQKYAVRSIIDFDSAGDKYLSMIEKIANANSKEDYRRIAEDADVRKVKRFRLPDSGFVIEVGPISCYEYLYKVLKVVNNLRNQVENVDENEIDPDISNKYELSIYLRSVRAINIPTKRGKYERITAPMKMINILSSIVPPNDLEILAAVADGSQSQYGISYSVKNATCPHCGTVTEAIPVTPDELVFYARQRLINTEITVDNFPAS